MSYAAVIGRKNEIMKKAIGIDYSVFESGGIGFDYERMMREAGYTLRRNTEDTIRCKRWKYTNN